MVNAGLERSRRMEAKRHASAALNCAIPVHHEWILNAATRPAATELKLAMNEIEKALAILRDDHGNHWEAANTLEYAAQTLYRMDRSELAEALQHANLAHAEIAEHRPTSRAFAREQFALKHRYAMVLHTDKDHPHVHLVVKAMGEDGTRLNIRKATLREWRREFARHLREHGIAANATDRAVRGVTKPRKRDGIYRAYLDDRSSHTYRQRALVQAELKTGKIRTETGKEKMLLTRREVERGWQAVSDALRDDHQYELAAHVDQFLTGMPRPQSQREWIAADLPNEHTPKSVKERPSAR